MILIPSLELLDGKVVRLPEGTPDSFEVIHDDPLEAAREFRRVGALFFHVVDLDAVFGRGDNDETLTRLVDDMMPFQVAGGVRSAERAAHLLDLGADRVVIGTLFFEDSDQAKSSVDEFGVRVMAALDVEGGEVRVHGRQQSAGLDLDAAVEKLVQIGVQNLVFTDLDNRQDVDVERVRDLMSRSDMQMFVHAGDSAPMQLAGLAELETGPFGAILGPRRADEIVEVQA